jgi:4-alpha-glucanotransferase
VTTHDLPPTAGYLAGEHVRLRERLGLLTRPADQELAADQAQQAAWLAELRRVGLLGSDTGDDSTVDDVVLALYRYLGRTPSKLLALSLADAVGDLRAQNQPGTTDEYPNWRVPLRGPEGKKLLLEDVFTDRRAAALAEAMNQNVHPLV